MTGVPAGWHPDPRGRHEHRYWDGERWTDHVADRGRMSIDPVDDAPRFEDVGSPAPALRAAPAPAQRPSPARGAAGVTATVAADAEPASGGSLWADLGPRHADPVPETTAGAVPGRAGEAPSAATAGGARSPELAALMSLVAPGSGHLYLRVPGAGRSLALVLLAATVLAVLVAYVAFAPFLAGLVIWLAGAAYALVDLRGPRAAAVAAGAAPPTSHALGWVLVASGTALALALVLPWYRVDIEARGIDAVSGTVSGLEALAMLDVVLLAVGAASAVLGLTVLGRPAVRADRLPPGVPRAMAAGGALAGTLVAFRMLADPLPDFRAIGPGVQAVEVAVGRAPGILLAGAAGLAMCAAGVIAMRTGYRRDP